MSNNKQTPFINPEKVDPDDYLGKAKTSTTFEQRQGRTATLTVIERLGVEACPPGARYVGSIATHVFARKKLDGTIDLEIQTVECLRTDSAWTVNQILRHMCIAVAKKFGWEFTKKQKTEIREL